MRWSALYALGFIIIPLGSAVSDEKKWEPTTLAPETVEKTRTATQAYHACLSNEIKAFQRTHMDFRDAATVIMKKCESELKPIRDALLAEQVPLTIVDRFLLRKRHQASRKVLRHMMYAESQRKAPQ